MPQSAHVRPEFESVIPARAHILTVREALEPLFLEIEKEAEVKMVAAAVKAGWSPEEAVEAIDALRRTELLPERSH